MGILRADRVSGLGGANAINGSAFFSGGTGIETEPFDGLYFGTNDLTIEMWVYFTGFETDFMTFLKTGDNTGANSMWQLDYKVSTNDLRFIPYVSDSSVVYTSSWTPTDDTWYHIAVSKSGTSIKLWVDGTQIGSTHTFSQTWDNEVKGMAIGHRAMGSYERDFEGYMSNLRIINGTALYTSNFTPPTTRLTKTSDTVFLAFQSPGDVLKEETGKILFPATDGSASAPAVASHFAPDLGEDYGTTFEDNTKFDTLSYMVPPGGTTAQSNRGRGLTAGGFTPGVSGQIYSVEIQSMGTSADFGELTQARRGTGAVSSSTRAVWGGGYAPGYQDTMDYVTIATSSNATDFGNLDTGRFESSGVSNNTRGVFGASENPAAVQNVMQYITIATTGNATDFGDSTVATKKQASMNSSTRGIFAGGQDVPSPTAYLNIIDYITIATTGNATDFGDLTQNVFMCTGVSSSTRGVRGGGAKSPSPANTNVMDYVTIATTGNATDYGDLTADNQRSGGMSNSTRGLFSGGATPNSSTFVNSIDFITIATTGNAADFGDYVGTAASQGAGCSDSHGGIS